MIKIIVMICGGYLFFFWEVRHYLEQRKWYEVFIVFLLVSTGLMLCILLSKNMTIPSPLSWIITLYRPIANVMENILS
ncbi:hypothetical protein CEQ21_04945 [Niallia circulans]|uniref:Uncharacterized protein n=1 Tax=Niallia circulans TaxID=1397 RepID=A0A553STF3_NIACI|nr:hypothetical protein CEQ21_04945 [Niallia circulans]